MMRSLQSALRASSRSATVTALLCLMLLSGEARPQMKAVGYYPMWKRTALPPRLIKFNSLTHLAHAFIWPNADASLTSAEQVVDTALINTTHRAGRKILISVGGAGQSAHFPAVVADAVLRGKLVGNLVSHVRSNGYDGVDLDWEGPSNAADRANEILLVRELRTALSAEYPGYLLTMAVGATGWSGQWHNYDSLEQYLDWIGVMTYDYHGSWSAHAGHNAPLYAGSDPDWSVDQSVQYMSSGRAPMVPRGQLLVGLPFYAIEFNAPDLYQPFTGPVTYLAYPDVVNRLAGNWEYRWDAISMVPYLLSPSRGAVVTFDDTASLRLKCQYAKDQGLGGVMIWELTQGVLGVNQPLMDAIGMAIYGTTTDVARAGRPEPGEYRLHANYPNPFNPSTTIRFELPRASSVRVSVHDLLGREVAILMDEPRNAGSYSVTFDGSDLSSGVYVYRLQAGDYVQSKKLMVLK